MPEKSKITDFFKRLRDDDACDEPEPKNRKVRQDSADAPSPHTLSKTAAELARVTREQAVTTIKRLRDGYKDKSGAGYTAAITNEREATELKVDICEVFVKGGSL
jgi:hypothetical protein